jgi:hypothetical protein
MKIKIPMAELVRRSKDRPDGYLAEVLSKGIQMGSDVEFDAKVISQLRKKYDPPLPTIAQMLENFYLAMCAWRASGFAVVSEQVFLERLAICRADLENWDESGFWPKCKVCGCSVLKLWLATSECPLKPARWNKVQGSRAD